MVNLQKWKKHTIKNLKLKDAWYWKSSFRLIGIHGGKLGGSSCTSQSGTCPSCDRWSHEESGAIPSKDLRHPFTREILGDLPINKRQIVCSLLMPPTFTCLEGSKVARIWGWWSTALYTVTLRHSINRKRRLHRIEFQDQAFRGHILSTVTEKHHLHPPRPLHLVALTTSLRRHFSDRDLLGWSHCELGTSSNHGYDFPLWDWWFQWKNTSQLDSKTWSSQVGWNFWTFESTSHIFSGRPSLTFPWGASQRCDGGIPKFYTMYRGKIQFHQIIYINGFKWYTTYTTYPEVAINRGIKHCWLAQTNLSIRLMFTALPDGTEGRRTHLLGNILPWNDGSLWLVVSASLVGEKHGYAISPSTLYGKWSFLY